LSENKPTSKPKPKSPKGRTMASWDRERADRFLLAIRNGVSVRGAAEFAGIAHATVDEWIRLGKREEEGIRHEFAQEYLAARGAVETEFVQSWRKAAVDGGDWRAAATWLARCRPEDYGERVAVQHGGSVGISLAELHARATGEHADALEG
jgi:hypothetical protein